MLAPGTVIDGKADRQDNVLKHAPLAAGAAADAVAGNINAPTIAAPAVARASVRAERMSVTLSSHECQQLPKLSRRNKCANSARYQIAVSARSASAPETSRPIP